MHENGVAFSSDQSPVPCSLRSCSSTGIHLGGTSFLRIQGFCVSAHLCPTPTREFQPRQCAGAVQTARWDDDPLCDDAATGRSRLPREPRSLGAAYRNVGEPRTVTERRESAATVAGVRTPSETFSKGLPTAPSRFMLAW